MCLSSSRDVSLAAPRRSPLLCCVMLLTGPLCFAEEAVTVWTPYEMELTADADLATPYVDGLPEAGSGYVTATFHGESGEAMGRELRVTGFWDGGRTWRIRFAPPAAGGWSYRTESADRGLDGRAGRFAAVEATPEAMLANPTLHGFVRVRREGPRAGRHFEYADGTPMLWIGDTWWDWAKPGISFDSMTKLVDDRAAKGFTVGQLFVGGLGWSPSGSFLNEDFTMPDLERLRHVERFIRYANSRGITVWVHGWWCPFGKERVGEENTRRWCRYLVHRLGAYNVIWTLAGEYNRDNYGGFSLDFWKGIGRLFDQEDPYERLISAHPTPPTYPGGFAAPQWSTAEVLHDEPWLDYNQSQVGHYRWTDELIPWVVARDYARQPPKPIVVTEPCYEFERGNPPASIIRFGAWAAVLSGAAGHSYGGGHVWRAHVPEAPAPIGDWPMDPGFDDDTLDYPAARAVGFMGRFLKTLPWYRWEPHPELMLEYPAPYLLATPGEEYLAYFRYSGLAKIDLRPSPEDSIFELRWVDPVAETVLPPTTVNGGRIWSFHPPMGTRIAEFQDWVLHLKRVPAAEAAQAPPVEDSSD